VNWNAQIDIKLKRGRKLLVNQMTEIEDDSNLFELKNDFILGNYQSVINNADNVSASSDRCDLSVSWPCVVLRQNYLFESLHGYFYPFVSCRFPSKQRLQESTNVSLVCRQKTLIKFYVYRAMVAQGDYMTVTGEVNDKSEPELRAVKLLADYLADVDQQTTVVTKVKVMTLCGIVLFKVLLTGINERWRCCWSRRCSTGLCCDLLESQVLRC
jgi:hypothetical protein